MSGKPTRPTDHRREPADGAAFTALPGVTEAACIGLPDARMGEVPVAVAVVEGRASATAGIWCHPRATVPTPSMPVRLLTLDALPRTVRGKLDKAALAEIFAARPDPAAAPGGDAR